MKKYLLSIILSVFLLSNQSFSQSRTFDDILKIRERNSGVLTENGAVRGYYSFYTIGKSKKGMRTYLLRILDENLEDVKNLTIEEPKSVGLLEGSYNGQQILLKFYDYYKREIYFRSYDLKGELVNEETRIVDNAVEWQSYGTKNTPGFVDNLESVSGLGFLDYTKWQGSRGYKIQMIPNDPNQKGWYYLSERRNRGYDDAVFIYANNELVISAVSRSKNANYNNQIFGLQALNSNNGDQIFNVLLEDLIYKYQPLNAYFDKNSDKILIMGVFFERREMTGKDNGEGLFRMELDRKGNILNTSHNSWKEINKFQPVTAKGKTEGGFIFFHDIIQSEDGSVIAVGEQYRKAADAAGIAVNVLSTALGGGIGASTTKMVIEDMIIYHFNPDFSIKTVKVIEKAKSNFSLPYGYDFYNVHWLSKIVKLYGGFDYLFTQNIEQDDAVSIGYIDHIKTPGSIYKKWVFGASTYVDGEFFSDKMELKTSVQNSVSVFQAKPGYITVLEHNKETKTISIRLERINY